MPSRLDPWYLNNGTRQRYRDTRDAAAAAVDELVLARRLGKPAVRGSADDHAERQRFKRLRNHA